MRVSTSPRSGRKQNCQDLSGRRLSDSPKLGIGGHGQPRAGGTLLTPHSKPRTGPRSPRPSPREVTDGQTSAEPNGRCWWRSVAQGSRRTSAWTAPRGSRAHISEALVESMPDSVSGLRGREHHVFTQAFNCAGKSQARER